METTSFDDITYETGASCDIGEESFSEEVVRKKLS